MGDENKPTIYFLSRHLQLFRISPESIPMKLRNFNQVKKTSSVSSPIAATSCVLCSVVLESASAHEIIAKHTHSDLTVKGTSIQNVV